MDAQHRRLFQAGTRPFVAASRRAASDARVRKKTLTKRGK